MNEPTNKTVHGGYRIGTSVAAVLLVIYFLCPYVYIWPTVLLQGKRSAPSPWLESVFVVVFYPVGLLERHVPIYRSLLEEEGRWFGLDD